MFYSVLSKRAGEAAPHFSVAAASQLNVSIVCYLCSCSDLELLGGFYSQYLNFQGFESTFSTQTEVVQSWTPNPDLWRCFLFFAWSFIFFSQVFDEAAEAVLNQ